MENPVIVLDSDSDDEMKTNVQPTEKIKSRLYKELTKQSSSALNLSSNPDPLCIEGLSSPKSDSKRKSNTSLQHQPEAKKIKRIKPTKISDDVTTTKQFEEEHLSNDDDCSDTEANNSKEDDDNEHIDGNENEIERTPINPAFQALVDACRKADSSDDMEKLIKQKLIRYYETVHPDFVNSKSFIKTALSIAEDINANPGLVYLKVSGILEELNIRRKSGQTVISNEEVTSTGNARRDYQIKRLNHALYVLKKKIAKLDEADVDLDDDDNSNYLLVERYKKRACEIYEKICDITGESKHAHRLVRKPITFQGTCYPEFNKTIQTFVNRTKSFPDMFDVLRCLEHCNQQYGFRLNKEEIKRIAQDAFIKIGKSLQKRRKTDLYETVSYFTGTGNDPAKEDTNLQSKLVENQKYHLRINEIIDKYAAVQDKSSTPDIAPIIHQIDDEEKGNKENQIANGNDDITENTPNIPNLINPENTNNDEDSDDETDDESDTTASVSTSKVNCKILDEEIVISDDEELILNEKS